MSEFVLESALASAAENLANPRGRASRTDVALAGDDVVGFHNLVVGEVSREQAPEPIRKELGRHPIRCT